MMIHLHLTAEQREDVQRVSRHAVGRVALRAHMVLLSDRAYSAPQIATIHDCGQDVMPLWLHRYDTEGRAGLDDESRSGLPRKGGDPVINRAGMIGINQIHQLIRTTGKGYERERKYSKKIFSRYVPFRTGKDYYLISFVCPFGGNVGGFMNFGC
jgi:hypothetical protein